MKIYICTLLICLSFCFTNSLLAVEILTAEADSYIVSNSSVQDSNYGTTNIMRIKNAASDTTDPVGGSWSRKAYVRFQLGLSENQDITDASFILTVARYGTLSGTQTFNVFGVKDGVTGENTWVETGITWNNAPGNDTGSRSDASGDALLLGTFNLTGTGTLGQAVNFSNNNLTEFLNKDTNNMVTLIITRDTYDSNYSGWVHEFASKENTSYNAPTLQFDTELVQTTAIPEPNSLLLLALTLSVIMLIYKQNFTA